MRELEQALVQSDRDGGGLLSRDWLGRRRRHSLDIAKQQVSVWSHEADRARRPISGASGSPTRAGSFATAESPRRGQSTCRVLKNSQGIDDKDRSG